MFPLFSFKVASISLPVIPLDEEVEGLCNVLYSASSSPIRFSSSFTITSVRIFVHDFFTTGLICAMHNYKSCVFQHFLKSSSVSILLTFLDSKSASDAVIYCGNFLINSVPDTSRQCLSFVTITYEGNFNPVPESTTSSLVIKPKVI